MDAPWLLAQFGLSALLLLAGLLALRWALPILDRYTRELGQELRSIAHSLAAIKEALERIESLYGASFLAQGRQPPQASRSRGRTPPPKEE